MNEIWQMYAFIRIQYCCDFGQKRQTASIKKMRENENKKEKEKKNGSFLLEAQRKSRSMHA